MTALELKRMKLELMKVAAARLELECRIDDYKESIVKLESSIEIQLAKEAELSAKIEEAAKILGQ